MALSIDAKPEGVVVALKVVPNSGRDEIVGLLGNALKVKVAAPPEGGKANAAVEELIARALGIAGKRVAIVAGHTQARKKVRILGARAEDVMRLVK